ncbi:MAG: asparaginase [Oscillospiraceae bacterium]|jgi:L-asparaginase|nr:asparaginase [Oscillospiraceae bacterium]
MEQKKILLIGTGGTIASEMGESGLAPELTSEQLLRYIPDISGICQVECLQLFSLDSTNIQPKHWARIASAIRAHYREFDGFVISHGTDTMAYTAAGLSYLVQGSPKPIVLTGAQKPIGFETTDSKQNLRDAVTVAASDMAGVMLVFNGKIIMGTRARKTRSKSFEAFSSINYPLLGMVRDGRIIRYIHPESRAVPQFYDDVNPRVALLKLIPGTDCGVAEFLLERNDALIIESFGVGGLPTYKAGDYYETVKAGLDAGKTVVMTTQVENEGSDLAVYHVGAGIKRNLPILEAYDMTSEAVTAKLMWILGQTTDRAWVQELFYTPVACDILAGK